MKSLSLYWNLATQFLLLLSINSHAQIYNFHNYNTEEGLAQSYIYNMLQSDDGCLWIGTGEGLSRFNGKDFVNYSTREGLAENFVTASFKDRNGSLWFGHYQGGLSYYNGNSFTCIKLPDIGSPVNSILEDKDGNIWISSQRDGLARISPARDIIRYKSPFTGYILHALSLGHDGRLIIGTNEGAFFVNIKEDKTELLRLPGNEYTGEVTVITPSADGKNYWIGTKDEGIILYQGDVQKTSHFFPGIKNINLIHADTMNNLYVGSFGFGLIKFNLRDGKLQEMAVYNKSTGLSNDYVRSVFSDRENNLWFGSYGSGLDLLVDPLFTLYNRSGEIHGHSVLSLLFDTDKNIWAGSDHGLSRYTFNNYGLQTGSDLIMEGLPAGEIKSLFQMKNKDVLIALASEGVYRYYHGTGKISRWFYNEQDPLSNRVNHITSDQEDNIWFATYAGVYKLQKDAEVFEQFTIADGLAHNLVYSIYPDSKGNIWFATHESGITKFYNGKFESLKVNGVEVFNINCFAQDIQERLWIGTYGDGIYGLDENKIVKHLSKANGLGSDYCYMLRFDRNNNLWVGHKEGISKYSPMQNKFHFYKKQDGFLGESVNLNSCIEDSAGCLWFGTRKGLVRYNPDSDKPNTTSPMTQITRVDLFYKNVEWKALADSLYGAYRLPHDPELQHNKNHLTFNFAGISLRPGEKLKYQYMLDGFDQKWSLLTNETFATYSNLPDGNYVFKVRAQNKEGLWGNPAIFTFHVLKPFWKTWWFISFLVIVSVVFVFFLIRLRTIHLHKRQLVLKKQRDRLLAEVKERKIAEKMRKESEKKLKQTNEELNTFIYRSSHDLKGPLASVIGLTYLAQKEISESNALNYFNMISDCTRKLDNILEGLLEATMIKDWKVECSMIHFDELVKNLLFSYAGEEKIQFLIDVSIRREFCSDAQLVGSTMQYIVDNSVKYRKTDGKSEVRIEVSDYKKGALIRISDNGIGIAESARAKVFDMFFKASLISKGAGLGLYLVKNSVGKLEGEVKLQSQEGKGTTVEVFLPSLLRNSSKANGSLSGKSFPFKKMTE
ncbi:MAG: two-component regulator propeller domain-containing protein [Cytophagaceae bacterium]